MKRHTPVILALILLAVHRRVGAGDFAGAMPILSLSTTAEYVPEASDDEILDAAFGMGIRVPLLEIIISAYPGYICRILRIVYLSPEYSPR
jgi:hypothetical protein